MFWCSDLAKDLRSVMSGLISFRSFLHLQLVLQVKSTIWSVVLLASECLEYSLPSIYVSTISANISN
jgi:hypothetical protein